MIYTQVSFNDFYDAFQALRPDNFSYEGLQALFEDLSYETGEPMELDVIAICCAFTESSLDDVRQEYRIDDDDVIGYLQDNTIVFELDNGNVLYQAF